MRDYRTADIQRWLDTAAKTGVLSRNSLRGSKAFLSSAFKEAKRLGYCDTNPVQDTRVPDGPGPADTYAYSTEEIAAILTVLPEPAATIFAIAAYSGLRRGEIEGLKWEDYRDGHLHVERSIWNGETVEPKSKKSKAAVPVIKQLAERLAMHHERHDKPTTGWIFNTSNDTPLSTHNVVNRLILPTLNRCAVCQESETDHAGADHEYERDASRPEWHGFHAARRGLGSNLYRLGVPSLIIQKILRRSNVAVTESYYIKSNSADMAEAMQKYEESFQASHRPVSSRSDQKPEFVN